MTLLVLMGSGETAPAMVKIHRRVVEHTTDGPFAMLDTPFGFQDNADDLTARTRTYFGDSVGITVDVASWRRGDQPAGQSESTLSAISQARWLFAGPGSPTYAMRQWEGTAIPAAMLDLLDRGGTLVLGSAAAVTAGLFALPVYEIYKVGDEPFWARGLDLLGSVTGVSTAVIPHYDNAEGGSYDTRYCYLGERRLTSLAARLPVEAAVLGIDEHTAVIVDADERRLEVAGTGSMTIRRDRQSLTFQAGTDLTFERFADLVRGAASLPAGPSTDLTDVTPQPHPQGHQADQPSLQSEVARLRATFDDAIVQRDVDGCVTSILELESALQAWSADTLQSDAMDRGRREVRAMVVRLGELARSGAVDPRAALTPFVDALLELRARSRAAKDFETGDLVRDRLTAAGVEVRDTPAGAEWQLGER